MTDYSLESLASFIAFARKRLQDDSAASIEPSIEDGQAAPTELGDDHHDYIATSPPPELRWAWQDLEARFEQGDTIKCIVTGWNRGGLLVRWNRIQGFVPASQLCDTPALARLGEWEDADRDEMLAHWVGEELDLKIIELDVTRNRLVFSERATLWAPHQGDDLLAHLGVGDICQGRVSNICDFGAFVDLGGIDGLIHISELSWGRVTRPSSMLEVDQDVQVYVLSVDSDSRHIGLSLKRLQPNPWEMVRERYAEGDLALATITNIADFGLFARIEEGIEGLIHISEISSERVSHPADMAAVGDRVKVAVLNIDCEHHRLSLSMRRANEQPDDVET